jgi:hypothetical protein
MLIDLDPDLWLCTRLLFGRRWRWALASITLGCAGLVVAEWPYRHRTYMLLSRDGPAGGNGNIVPFVVLLLAVAAAAPAVAVAALERSELFDCTRLCGRPPIRILAALAAGWMWPAVALAGVLLGLNQTFWHSSAEVASSIVLIFLLTAFIGLVVLACLPAHASPIAVSGLLIGGGFIGGFTALLILFETHEIHRLTIIGPAMIVAIPIAFWLASRRLDRPRPAWGRGRDFFSRLRRLVPPPGPAEFNRTLRSTVAPAVGIAIFQSVAIVAVLVFAQRLQASNARDAAIAYMVMLPYTSIMVGGLAALASAQRQFGQPGLELVRLTSQRPEAIAFGLYAGNALPFLIVAEAVVAVFRFASPGLFAAGPRAMWLLVAAVGIVVPAVFLADGLDRRWSGRMLLMSPPIVLLLSGFNRLVAGRTVLAPWHLHLEAVIPCAAWAIALGVAIGRIRRPVGPALVGPAAAAAIAAIALATAAVPAGAYPRAVVALLLVSGSLFAEDTEPPSAPWTRVAIGAASAAVMVALILQQTDNASASIATTAACAALALGVGLLGHELLARWPGVSLALPIVAVAAILRTFTASVPPALQPVDVAVLATVFAAACLAHPAARRPFAPTAIAS